MTVSFNLLHLIYIFVGIIIGMYVGIIAYKIYIRTSLTQGIIIVDRKNDECVIRMSSGDLLDKKTKFVTFEVSHMDDYSRTNHGL